MPICITVERILVIIYEHYTGSNKDIEEIKFTK